MKFVCQHDYRQFRGYVFYKGVPTEVRDQVTIDLCMKDRSFQPVEPEKGIDLPNVGTQESAPKESWDGDKCLKCGKSFRRGKFFHAKYCRGV